VVVAIKISIHQGINEIPAENWNALVKDNNPFVRHEFLLALEVNGCVSDQFGWYPRHVSIYEGDTLVAAMMLYEKTNSYGEFVFDNAWADAYQRSGIAYFPKLVSSIPYTPATGQRFLCIPGREAELFPLLKNTLLQLAEKTQASSIHCLFSYDDSQEYLQGENWLHRNDCQYHWNNQGYKTFDGFLEKLTSKKRKNIRQERRKTSDAGIQIRQLNGHTATKEDWRNFAHFYDRTFEEKWGTATLNYNFFVDVAEQLPDQVLLVLADDANGETIAGSLMYRSDTRLFGRHWGCIEYVNSLHFEACYYQGIEYAIKNGLSVFEPGAGGEHKISRGFTPTLTRSAHWVFEPGFKQPIADFVERERQGVAQYIQQKLKEVPYKK